MEKPSLSTLDPNTAGSEPNTLIPSTRSKTSSIASIERSFHEKDHEKEQHGLESQDELESQEEPQSQEEPGSEDDVGWSRLIFVVIALILSIFMVCEISVRCYGC